MILVPAPVPGPAGDGSTVRSAVDLVQVIVPFLGGGFGSKSYTKMEPLTAAVARRPAARSGSSTGSTSR